jgi:hypothetical protein
MPDLAAATERLASLLTRGGAGLVDPSGPGLVFEKALHLHSLVPARAPADVWAVDGGQALVADARCVALVVTRAATVRWQAGRTTLEDEGELRPHLLGLGEERASLAALRSPVSPDAPVDINLLRDWGEWEAVAAAVERAQPGGMVLVDGDLQPDWRIPASWVGSLLTSANAAGVTLVGVTKHSSLARGGAPLVGSLEADGAALFGPRGCWWARIACTRPELGPGLEVYVARLDPDARFAFRVDLPAGTDPEVVLAALAGLCDDAAFPGYPYPLSLADRLAACPPWLRTELWGEVEAGLVRAGVAAEVVERAFSDRHRLMERA